MTKSDGSTHSQDSHSDSSAAGVKRRSTRQRKLKRSTGRGGGSTQSSRGGRPPVPLISASSFNRGPPSSNPQLYNPTAGQQDQPRSQNLEQTRATSALQTDLPARAESARVGVGSRPSSQIKSQPSGIATLPPEPEISAEESLHRGSVVSTPQPPAPTGSAVGLPAQTPSQEDSLAGIRKRQDQIIRKLELQADSDHLASLMKCQDQAIQAAESPAGTDKSASAPSLGSAPLSNRATTLSLNQPRMPAADRRFQGEYYPSPSLRPRNDLRNQGWSYQRDWQNARNPSMRSALGPVEPSSPRRYRNRTGPYSNEDASQTDQAADDVPSVAGQGPTQ